MPLQPSWQDIAIRLALTMLAAKVIGFDIIVTTAENDVYLTDHANTILASHAKRGLFRVTVFGWSELVRRLYNYPDLVRNAAGDAAAVRGIADQVVEKLQNSVPLLSPAKGNTRFARRQIGRCGRKRL